MKTLKELIDEFIYESQYECHITSNPHYISAMKKRRQLQIELFHAIKDNKSDKTIEELIENMSYNDTKIIDVYRYIDIKTAFEAGIMIGIEARKSKNNELLSKIDKLLKE